MSPEITKIIEQYLANELSHSDKIAFEKKLAESKSLQDEVIRQQNIHAAAKRASKRTEIQQIGKSYHFFKKVLTTGIVVAVIVVVSSLGYLAYKMTSNSESEFQQSEEVKALIEKLKKESPIDEVASEFFFWEGKDSVILSDEGVLLSVPEKAFLLKGKPYNEKAIIQWQEAMDPATIVKSGLSTMAGDRLLETQGMFGVQAYTKDGQKLDVNPKVGVYVQVPVDQYKSGMQLFTGSTNKDGIIDWKNPKPLQKIPVPVDMKELDFYPKGYENALNEMKKSKKKSYRDSLYLSFDEGDKGIQCLKQLIIELENNILPRKLQKNESDFLFSLVKRKEKTLNVYNAILLTLYSELEESDLDFDIFLGISNQEMNEKVKQCLSNIDSDVQKEITFLTFLKENYGLKYYRKIELNKYLENLKNGVDNIKSYNEIDYSYYNPEVKKIALDIRKNMKWEKKIIYLDNGEADIIYTVTTNDEQILIPSCTNIFMQTYLHLTPSTNYNRLGNLKNISKYETIKYRIEELDNEIYDFSYSKNKAVFSQRIKILSSKPFNIKSRVDTDYLIDRQNQINSNIDPHNLMQVEEQQFFTVDIKSNSNSNNKILSNISPTKVMAFWKPQFNKTLLATREFERRMQSIHTTCDNKVLDLYTSNLSKSMQEIDEMAVSMGYPVFAEFAKEQIGALNPNSPHLKGLQSFYEREIKKLKRIVEANAKYDQKKKAQWDKDVQTSRNREQKRTVNRENKALNQEYEFNLKNVSKQLGKSVGFMIHGGGTVFNIDKYVMDATVSRTSTVITDPETGKKATITYNPFSFEVQDSKEYGKLYAYLFPSALNSYQRISGKNGKFEYPLNNHIDYDLAIVGVSDKGYFYKELKECKKGNLGTLNLTEISEKELDQKIVKLNTSRGIIKPMGISDEIDWLMKEQKNYKEEKRRKETAEFRNKIKKVIFPCYQGEVRYEFTVQGQDSIQ